MKHVVRIIAACVMLAVSMTAVAMAENATVTIQTVTLDSVSSWLEPAAGEWYNTKGTLIMTVEGSTINGCSVTAQPGCTYDYPRTGHFTIAEAQGPRSVTLDLLGHKSHQYLIVDNKTALRRSIRAEYSESIGGMYLGMTKEDLLAAYQQPANMVEDQGMERWEYSTHHMDVFLKGGIVMAIRVYTDCDLKFDRSGLHAADTPEAFAQAYGFDSVPVVPAQADSVSPGYKLPQGEYFHVSQNYVELSVM